MSHLMRIALESGKVQDKELQAQYASYTWLQFTAISNDAEQPKRTIGRPNLVIQATRLVRR